jgi:hypothetical protein
LIYHLLSLDCTLYSPPISLFITCY